MLALRVLGGISLFRPSPGAIDLLELVSLSSIALLRFTIFRPAIGTGMESGRTVRGVNVAGGGTFSSSRMTGTAGSGTLQCDSSSGEFDREVKTLESSFLATSVVSESAKEVSEDVSNESFSESVQWDASTFTSWSWMSTLSSVSEGAASTIISVFPWVVVLWSGTVGLAKSSSFDLVRPRSKLSSKS